MTIDKEKRKIQELIRRYRTKEYKVDASRTRLKNEIFMLMHKKVIGYIKGFLSRRHRYEDESMILSMSWDAFLFCLDRYDDEKYDIYGHFNTYTKYFLLLHYAGGKEVSEVPVEDLEGSGAFANGSFVTVDKFVELKSFRDSLVQENHRRIFDHIVLGEHRGFFSNIKKERGGTSCYTYYRHYGVRDAFRLIINYLIGRKEGE